MGHRITLTGNPVSSIRQVGNFLSFDMEEGGISAVPKGLPASAKITYTVFTNLKQLKKAGLEEDSFRDQKIMVQGEPTLDVPIDQCPGEIGVVCFQLSILPDKKETKEAGEKEKVKETELLPKGTKELIPLESVIVPEEFQMTKPNEEKTQAVIQFVEKNGHLDEPIAISRKSKQLVDGYRRYIVAKRLNMEKVPVFYV